MIHMAFTAQVISLKKLGTELLMLSIVFSMCYRVPFADKCAFLQLDGT